MIKLEPKWLIDEMAELEFEDELWENIYWQRLIGKPNVEMNHDNATQTAGFDSFRDSG